MMHAESLAAQERCLAAFEQLGAGFENNVKYAQLHLDIIARFGRFPHRNALFGRVTAREEQAFLDGGGFAG